MFHPKPKKIKNMLLQLIKEAKHIHLILLRDIKDVITNVSIKEWKNIPQFFKDIQKGPEIQMVPGNLEPLLLETKKILPTTFSSFRNVGLFHGHAWQSPELLECRSRVSGHVHPTIAIRDPQRI